MIEDNLMEYLRGVNGDDMTYSVNSARLKDNIVTIYSSSGPQPSLYEGVLRTMRYQIIIKSSDFDKAKELAYLISQQLEQLKNTVFNVQLQTFSFPVRLYNIYLLQEPIMLGTDDQDVMSYSLNFETKLIKVQQHS